MNACMNPVCAVTGLTMSRAMGDPIVFQIVDALVKECIRVARANEIDLGWDFYTHAMEYMGNAGDHKPSMLMDIEANRRTEIDFINGKFVEYGARTGTLTPYNHTLSALVKGLESKYVNINLTNEIAIRFYHEIKTGLRGCRCWGITHKSCHPRQRQKPDRSCSQKIRH